MDEETEEAVATNKAVVRSKRKKSRMNRFVFGTRSAIKKKMTEAVASNKAIRHLLASFNINEYLQAAAAFAFS
ncbi:hypothetical protein TSUD_248630 [Trifolium subterraneum]|uniref:Uncharacterized protein n=1 Tax=Trifolium subterraneum TaxID=3900 RepID=A0A2Z6LPA3_TRISU|nr:hypothetical protein TSUD_248630 [Trifolium subterraneum]